MWKIKSKATGRVSKNYVYVKSKTGRFRNHNGKERISEYGEDEIQEKSGFDNVKETVKEGIKQVVQNVSGQSFIAQTVIVITVTITTVAGVIGVVNITKSVYNNITISDITYEVVTKIQTQKEESDVKVKEQKEESDNKEDTKDVEKKEDVYVVKDIIKDKEIKPPTIQPPIFIIPPPSIVFASTIAVIEPNNIQVERGKKFSIDILLDPNNEKNYTVKIEVLFPQELVRVVSFEIENTWVELKQKNYDLIDNANGIVIKTAGYPNGFDITTKFGNITFIAKKTGTGFITIGDMSIVLNINNNNVIEFISNGSFVEVSRCTCSD